MARRPRAMVDAPPFLANSQRRASRPRRPRPCTVPDAESAAEETQGVRSGTDLGASNEGRNFAKRGLWTKGVRLLTRSHAPSLGGTRPATPARSQCRAAIGGKNDNQEK